MIQEVNHFKHKVHVLFKREDLDYERLEGKVAIVLDVLFATTTIIHAIHSGAKDVIPTLNEGAARGVANNYDESARLLAGELYGETLPGFLRPTPLRLAEERLSDKTLIYSTTNGTVALKQAAAADEVFVGALINAEALVDHVLSSCAGKTILVVCSGSMGNPNLEDAFGAGYFIDLLKARMRNAGPDAFSDTAEAARMIFKSELSVESLLRSRVGRMMVERGMEEEVRFAANLSTHQTVPKVFGGIVKPV
ncbi:MAG: 2-phosphosulfolactate phosphatase [Proteobacteria bacterium]|nr:2-phosphosulfolactate phosphatase [Pseudomonadota bacterium]MDA1330937.1 2-phosphosulfolactate phosphatase [Pseudomonadota bacterium]